MRCTKRQAIGLAVSLLWLCTPGQSRAYCLAYQCDPDNSASVPCERDANGCSIQGAALRRRTNCVTVSVAQGSTKNEIGIDDNEFAAVITEAFSLWTNVDCGGGSPPGLKVQFAGAVAANGPFACEALPAQNIDVWRVSNTFPSPSGVTQTTGAIAGRTKPIFTLPDGKIFDADVELNGLWLSLFLQDPVQMRGILRTVAAHEAGHALGLAHSLDGNSLMFRSYDVMPMRVPTPDDVRGICTLFPPASLQCSPPVVPAAALRQTDCDNEVSASAGGCSVSSLRPSNRQSQHASLGLLLIAVLAFAVYLRLGTQSSRHR
jgi:Matrixin